MRLIIYFKFFPLKNKKLKIKKTKLKKIINHMSIYD